jgi:hypothetical protein
MKWEIFYKSPRVTYQVSDCGEIMNVCTGKTLKTYKNTIGYSTIKINKKWFLIHRLVAEKFIGDISNKIIHHKNNNPLDNRVDNLEITTQSENIKYAVKSGNHKGFANLKGQNQYTKAKRLGLPKPKTKNQYTK